MLKLTGRCHCGAVEFEIADDEHLVRLEDCGCRDCQRATGALKVPFISVNPPRLKFTKGCGKVFKANGGQGCDKHGRWMFCESCGTMLMWMEDADKFYTVLPGTINEVDVLDKIPLRK
jgi:hypothetical protein